MQRGKWLREDRIGVEISLLETKDDCHGVRAGRRQW